MERQIGRSDRCSKCGNIGKVDLANISQEYKRDLTDWEWLCRKCHMNGDGRLANFLSYSKNKKLEQKECIQCGSIFNPHNKRSRFCCMSCRSTWVNLNNRIYKN